jgi:hypothetical protein
MECIHRAGAVGAIVANSLLNVFSLDAVSLGGKKNTWVSHSVIFPCLILGQLGVYSP